MSRATRSLRRFLTRPKVIVTLVFIGGALLMYPATHGEQQPGVTQTAQLVRVIDGDTIRVQVEGEDHRVRILGIDAPELARDGTPAECYAVEATAALRVLLADVEKVSLVTDPTQAEVDVYGRLLRYVEVDERDIGRALITQGAAEARLGDRPPVQRMRDYRPAERRAQRQSAGLWGSCEETP